MELTYECPACGQVGRTADVEHAPAVECRCGKVRELHPSAFASDGGLAACPWCATADLYVQKDFPQNLGLAVIVLGFAVSTVFWYLYRPLSAFAVLLATVFIDAFLYYFVKDVTICYRCLSQYRGAGANSGGAYKPFDLAIGERYRQERLRAEELRKQGRTAGDA